MYIMMASNNMYYCQFSDIKSQSDDSGDENSNCILRSVAEPLLQNEECYMCNGFYGPCFGEPVCATCHSFLFPDYAVNGEHMEAATEKSDDGDSGNDEPADALYSVERQVNVEKTDYVSEPGSSVAPPDSVVVRLELLTLMSERNKQEISNIHIESLPPEDDWFQTYTALMKNCSCSVCLQQMAVKIHPPGEESSWRRNRLRSELKILRSDPPDGIQAIPLDPPTCCHWQATIQGPVGSPYEGGIFFLYLQVPYSYPMCPPVVRFLTKIFHPNISRHGDVGIDSIHYNWSLALTLSKVLISVQSLLTDPYCEVCMEPEIGKLYTTDRFKFETIARRWTWRYAMTDLMPNL